MNDPVESVESGRSLPDVLLRCANAGGEIHDCVAVRLNPVPFTVIVPFAATYADVVVMAGVVAAVADTVLPRRCTVWR